MTSKQDMKISNIKEFLQGSTLNQSSFIKFIEKMARDKVQVPFFVPMGKFVLQWSLHPS